MFYIPSSLKSGRFTVRDLIHVLQEQIKENPEIKNYTIALEQHPDYKECPNCNKEEDSIISDVYCNQDEGEVFIKSHAIGCVIFNKEKTIGIQIHY